MLMQASVPSRDTDTAPRALCCSREFGGTCADPGNAAATLQRRYAGDMTVFFKCTYYSQ